VLLQLLQRGSRGPDSCCRGAGKRFCLSARLLPCLQAIDTFRPTHRLLEKPLRLPVADVARSGKAGVTVGGKLEGGALRIGSRVLLMPSGQHATVK
jgi:sulfate adenylyltransferase subunit 1 (EFTu-like GTPase family)